MASHFLRNSNFQLYILLPSLVDACMPFSSLFLVLLFQSLNIFQVRLQNQQTMQQFSLETFSKSVAFSGLILILFYTTLFNNVYNHPFNHLLHSKFTLLASHNATNSTSNISHSPTNISHIVFGISGTVSGWKFRKSYIQAWWRPNVTRGYLFLDRAPTREFLPWSSSSPPFRVSEDINRLKAYRKIQKSFQIRLFRSILETFREADKDVRWFVMADDDTLIFVDNLVDVLAKYDHAQYLYIGTTSECVTSNVYASFGMAFGGAGYALSYPLAKALIAKLDVCIEKYHNLYASDLMLYSCLTDLGVALTPEKGFHQIDLHNDISGLLSAHPQTPLISLHHMDVIDPIFPSMNRSESVEHLMKASKVDSSRLLQQTICYYGQKTWSFSVSWGYSTHIYENIFPRNVLVKPIETFWPWRKNEKPHLYMFDTRGLTKNPCEAPHVFFFDSVENSTDNQVVTTYIRARPRNLPPCFISGNHSADSVYKIHVFSPAIARKEVGKIECCDVQDMTESNVTYIRLRACRNDDIIS